ncbi:MAG: hypothetical protein Q8T08_21860, partial [Ignavibacteria bacterium]|nr:hypothetical protein [Ignavibacteria bacterium]
MNRNFLLLIVLLNIFISCGKIEDLVGTENRIGEESNKNISYKYADDNLELSIPLWYNNHKAAVSITYDAAWEGTEEYMNK